MGDLLHEAYAFTFPSKDGSYCWNTKRSSSKMRDLLFYKGIPEFKVAGTSMGINLITVIGKRT